MWRCFSVSPIGVGKGAICSTHVEMFRLIEDGRTSLSDLLHACGDVSIAALIWSHTLSSAPRMWRCFSVLKSTSSLSVICSTHVEMFPVRFPEKGTRQDLLHACGDVSTAKRERGRTRPSAPRMWRCFQSAVDSSDISVICSTHVEMFLSSSRLKARSGYLLHACGDVSHRMVPAGSLR